MKMGTTALRITLPTIICMCIFLTPVVRCRPFKPHQGMKFKTRMCLKCDVMLDLGKQAELAAAVTKMQTKSQQNEAVQNALRAEVQDAEYKKILEKSGLPKLNKEGLAPLIGAVGKAEGKVLGGLSSALKIQQDAAMAVCLKLIPPARQLCIEKMKKDGPGSPTAGGKKPKPGAPPPGGTMVLPNPARPILTPEDKAKAQMKPLDGTPWDKGLGAVEVPVPDPKKANLFPKPKGEGMIKKTLGDLAEEKKIADIKLGGAAPPIVPATPNKAIMEKLAIAKGKRDSKLMLRGSEKIPKAKVLSILSPPPKKQNEPKPKIKPEKPLESKAKNHYASLSKDMIKALLKKDKEDKTEKKKEKKKEEREGKQSTKPISTKEPTKKSVPKIQLSANARNAQRVPTTPTEKAVVPRKKVPCPPLVALPRNDFDPNYVHTEADFAASRSGDCGKCSNSKVGADCAKKYISKEKEMSLNQAKVAAKVGDTEATKASLDMAEKPGKFEPLPIYNVESNQLSGGPKEVEKPEKGGEHSLEREHPPRSDTIKPINVPLGNSIANGLLIEEKEENVPASFAAGKKKKKGSGRKLLQDIDPTDEETTLDEGDPGIARMLNPALKKGSDFDDTNTAKHGKKDPRVSADHPVGTKVTDIDTSGSSTKHIATMTICINESSMELIRQLFISVTGPDTLVHCKPAHSNRDWEDPEDPNKSKWEP